MRCGSRKSDIERRAEAMGGIGPLPSPHRYEAMKGDLQAVWGPELKAMELEGELSAMVVDGYAGPESNEPAIAKPEGTQEEVGEPKEPKPGRPIKISVNGKREAFKAKARGETNQKCAAILYGLPYPTSQQKISVTTVLRQFARTNLTLVRDLGREDDEVRRYLEKNPPYGAFNFDDSPSRSD